MDSQALPLLTAVASLVVGALLCWLAMRGRISAAATAAAQEKPQVQTELTLARERLRSLETDHQSAAADHEAFKLQATQWREALDLARSEQAQLAEQASQVSALEARLLTLQDQENAIQRELLHLTFSHASDTESLKLATARVAALEDENATLRRSAAQAPTALESAGQHAAATPEPQATKLPVLEEEVVALQSLAKTIQQEFLLLVQLHRDYTATSATLHELADEPSAT